MKICPTSVLLVAFRLPDLIEDLDLLNDSVVQAYDILRLDVGAPVLLEYLQFVSNMKHAVEDRLFFRIEWGTEVRRVGHVVYSL